MDIFEIKNGVYNIKNAITGEYEVYFLIFDKEHPQDDGVLIKADNFKDYIHQQKEGFKYHFGFPTTYISKERVEYIIHTFYTEHEYISHCYYNN